MTALEYLAFVVECLIFAAVALCGLWWIIAQTSHLFLRASDRRHMRADMYHYTTGRGKGGRA